MIRVADFTKGEARHSYLRLNNEATGGGIAKELLANQVALYQKTKGEINSVSLTADINVGTYAWAKYGFVPDKPAWDKVRSRYKIPDHFDKVDRDALSSMLGSEDPKMIWAVSDYKSKATGKKLGWDILRQQEWHGVLNLNDPESMTRFNAYIGRK
jgi:hypothetical protein